MNAFLKAAPLAALLGAWGWTVEAPERRPSLGDAWVSRDFNGRLETEAARAASELRSEPDIAGARVRVKSVDDHAPLRVEVELEPVGNEISAPRQESLLAGVRARFDSFAVVHVIRTEAGR